MRVLKNVYIIRINAKEQTCFWSRSKNWV